MFARILVLAGVALSAASGASQTIDVDAVFIRIIDEVEVPSRATGALSKVLLREGSEVQEGDLLAQIDDTEVKLALRRAEGELEIAKHLASDDTAVRSAKEYRMFAEADFARRARARKNEVGAVSISEFERAKVDAEQARFDIEKAESEFQAAAIRQRLAANDVAMAKRNVETRRIVAPISGVIVETKRKVGEWVQPGDAIFRIVRTDRLRAEGFVNASDAVRGLKGANVELTPIVAGVAGQAHSGKIAFVSPEIDPINGQVRIWADFENPSGQLRPGLRARMQVSVSQ